ncbi:MAG: bifunctional 4-hydroxy-2-oxoglutarate aldolase/2-dehydro-3-deoxy-phosphogluconate aldolase [Enterobacteriaceae bacterium]
MSEVNKHLARHRIMPLVVVHNAADGVMLAQTLMDNGLPCAEVAFRTPAAAEAIRQMRSAFPEMLIGAGTILTPEQANIALDAGVDFIVSPGFNPTTVRYCQQRGVDIIPGVNSPSQVEQAMEMGLNTLKFFPAEVSGGVAMLKAFSSVYPVRFMPSGGLNPDNLSRYLALPCVIACSGSWMVADSLVAARDWQQIGRLVREAVQAVAQME